MAKAWLARGVVATALAFGLPSVAICQSSANYALPQSAFNAGVDHTTSASYGLSSSLGDPFFSGSSSSASYVLRHGLWEAAPAATQVLSVSLTGSGSGTVTSAPPGISCPGTCSNSFATSSTVTLSAAANAGSVFTAWSGACSGAGSCLVTMSSAQSVTATFGLVGTPPVTTITGHPTDPSSVSDPQFTFTSDQPGSTFRCSLDGSVFHACSSPKMVHVFDGSHTFAVQAIGPGGIVDPVGASFTWLVQGAGGGPAAPGTPIPTLADWALVVLSLALGLIAAFGRRKAT
jgi:hypothetical protein